MTVEHIGEATLYLGDCVEVLPTIGRVDSVITDPPYEEQAHKPMKRTRAKLEGRVDNSDLDFNPMDTETREFLTRWSAENVSRWGLFFCQVEAVYIWKAALEAAGASWDRAWAWVKPDSAPRFNGQGPAQAFECIASAWCGAGARSWNGGGARNVITCNVTSGRYGGHPTEKPLPVMRRLIAAYTSPGEIILDPFMGSGSTGVVAVQDNRQFVGVEKDPKYFDLACRRIDEAQRQMSLAL